MSDVTQILSRIESGDSSAADQLLPLVYDELRQLASGRMDNESADFVLAACAQMLENFEAKPIVTEIQEAHNVLPFLLAVHDFDHTCRTLAIDESSPSLGHRAPGVGRVVEFIDRRGNRRLVKSLEPAEVSASPTGGKTFSHRALVVGDDDGDDR